MKLHHILFPMLLLAQSALAQGVDEQLRDDLMKLHENRPSHWKGALNLGTTFSFTQSQNVIGSQDGVTTQIGGLLDATGEYINGRHTWTSTLKALYSESKTPVLDKFIKASDSLEISTTYLYRFMQVPWMGPYARLRLATQMQPGYIVKASGYTLARQQADGTVINDTYAGQVEAQVTGAFDPLLLNEDVGLFANPTESDAVTVKLKIGLGTQQLLSSWGYALVDDPKTDVVEVKFLRQAVQVGGNAEAAITGKISDDFHWKARAAFFYPFYTNIDRTPTGIDALNSEFSAGISYKLAKWVSIDYLFGAKRVPLVSTEWQIQNGAVLTAGFTL